MGILYGITAQAGRSARRLAAYSRIRDRRIGCSQGLESMSEDVILQHVWQRQAPGFRERLDFGHARDAKQRHPAPKHSHECSDKM
jgi:hypothetical protein